MPSSQFTDSVTANVAFWRRQIAGLEESRLPEIKPDWPNLYRAVEFGLSLEECWQEAAELILDTYSLIDTQGYWREWIPLCERAVERCGHNQLSRKGRLLGRLGDFYHLSRQFSAAEAVYLEEEKIGLALGDQERLAYARLGLGKLAWNRRDHETAERYAQSALNGFQLSGDDPRKTGTALNLLGLAAHAQGKYALAEERLSRSLNHHRRTGSRKNIARALNILANTQQMLGKTEAALDNYQAALSLLEGTTDELDRTQIWLSLGTLHYKQGRFRESESAYLQANSPFLRRSGLSYRQAEVTNNLGHVYLAMGQAERAERYLRLSVELWRKADAQLMLANTLGTLAETVVSTVGPADALLLIDEAIELVGRFPTDQWAQDLHQRFLDQRRTLKEELARESEDSFGSAGASEMPFARTGPVY